MKIYQGSSGEALTPKQYAEEMKGTGKNPKLNQEEVEIEKLKQDLPTNLASDISQSLYYSAAEKKLNDKLIKDQLRRWLFDRFPTEDPVLENLRDTVVREVLSKLNELQKKLPKKEPMPKENDEFNDIRIILLTAAVIKVSAEVAVRGDDNEAFKLGMLRSFLT